MPNPTLKDFAGFFGKPGFKLQGVTTRPAPSGSMPVSVYLPIDAVNILNAGYFYN